MTSTLTSPKSLNKQRKDTHYYSYLARKKRSFEEETFDILTDNYRNNKRFLTEIMVQQFSLLTVSKSEKMKPLHQETNNKINHTERRIRKKLPKIKTFNTTLNSPLSQPPIVISFNSGSEGSEPTSDNTLSELKSDTSPSTVVSNSMNDDDEESSTMSDASNKTLEMSIEESI